MQFRKQVALIEIHQDRKLTVYAIPVPLLNF